MTPPKNIVLAAFYAPPSNNIAADRAKGYMDYLPKNGIHVHVITRFFTPEQQLSNSMTVGTLDAQLSTHFEQMENVYYTNYTSNNKVKKTAGRLPPGIRGWYNLKKVDVFHEGWRTYFFEALKAITLKQKIDAIVLSYGPPVVLSLIPEIQKTYHIPILVEFRDAYINEQDKGFIRRIKVKNSNRLLKNVAGFIFASQGMKDYFNAHSTASIAQKPQVVLYHGFDEATLKQPAIVSETEKQAFEVFNEFKSKHKVVAIFPGTLYKGQDMDFFVEVCKKINAQEEGSMGICFVGTYFDARQPIDDNEHVLKLPKVSKHCTIQLLQESDILLVPVWHNRYTGFSGKISEYCYLNKLIVVSPNPQADLKDYLTENKNAYFFSNQNEFIHFVVQVSRNNIKPVLQDVNKYTRSTSYSHLAQFMNNLIK